MRAMREPGLTEGDTVSLYLDGVFETVPARVVAFLGPVALLLPDFTLSPSHLRRLASGVHGMLVVTNRRRLHGLGGDVTITGEHLAMRLTDDFSLGQRRRWSRAGISLDAVLMPIAGRVERAVIETQTTDVSPGGLQVLWPEGRRVAERYRITLSAPGLGDPILAEAVPTRTTEGHLGLRFCTIEPVARRRLVELVLLVLNHLASASRRADAPEEELPAEPETAPAPVAEQETAAPAAHVGAPSISGDAEPAATLDESPYSDPWSRGAKTR